MRAQLDRSFVRHVRNSGHNLVTLAALSGFAAHTQLSAALNARTIAPTPKMVARLEKLREVVGYDAPIWMVRRG